MRYMFRGASSFDQDLGIWDISNLLYAWGMFINSNLSNSNYDQLLIGWEDNAHNTNVHFDAGHAKYCAGETARDNLIADGWVITDGGKEEGCGSLQFPEEYAGIDPNDAGFNIYPNPSDGHFIVSTNNPVKIEVFNSIGRWLLSKQVDAFSKDQLDLSSYPSGIYYVNYWENEERSIKKILVQ